MAKMFRWYHFNDCLYQVFTPGVVERIRRGGQASAGNGLVAAKYPTDVKHCSNCGEPILIGERGVRYEYEEEL